MELKEKEALLEKELNEIQDTKIVNLVRACMNRAPDYAFLDCPSSSTGKHHPADELGPDGNIIHTKKVTQMAQILCRSFGREDIMDMVVAACILHDLTKRGMTRGQYTIKHHARMMANLVLDVYAEQDRPALEPETVGTISSAIAFHYGPWTENTIWKSMDCYSVPELIVYLADYLASRKNVFVK